MSVIVGIQLAEISTMPQPVIIEAKQIAKKITEEKKVFFYLINYSMLFKNQSKIEC